MAAPTSAKPPLPPSAKAKEFTTGLKEIYISDNGKTINSIKEYICLKLGRLLKVGFLKVNKVMVSIITIMAMYIKVIGLMI